MKKVQGEDLYIFFSSSRSPVRNWLEAAGFSETVTNKFDLILLVRDYYMPDSPVKIKTTNVAVTNSTYCTLCRESQKKAPAKPGRGTCLFLCFLIYKQMMCQTLSGFYKLMLILEL